MSDDPEVVTVGEDDENGRSSTRRPLNAQAQSRMTLLSNACKRYEFVPFTKDGQTVFVKFNINLDESKCVGSVATFVIRLLTEGYWTLFVYGKKVPKTHEIYPMFSCENNLACSSKNYKLNIAKVEELFSYLNQCQFCIGYPEAHSLCREHNIGKNGLTNINLTSGAQAVEVMRIAEWEGRTYPSTLVHKSCELIRYAGSGHRVSCSPKQWFKCSCCESIKDELKALVEEHSNGKSCNSCTAAADASKTSSIEAVSEEEGPAKKRICDVNLSEQQQQEDDESPPSPIPVSSPPSPGLPARQPWADVAKPPPGPVFVPAERNDPIFLFAKDEDGKLFILKDKAGDFYCNKCPIPFRFPNQMQRVSFNEHLWMKHHIFVDSIAIWCRHCKKPFFDSNRYNIHLNRDHGEQNKITY